jgi:hypothetical protein
MTEVFVPFQPASRRRGTKQSAPAETPARPAQIARQLALAHELQRRIESGEFRNQAALARSLDFSRERISKILALTLLAPDVQEEILFLRWRPKAEWSESNIVAMVDEELWSLHRLAWADLRRRATGGAPKRPRRG